MPPKDPNVENPTKQNRILTVHSIENNDPLSGAHKYVENAESRPVGVLVFSTCL